MTIQHPLAARDAAPAAVTGPDGDTYPVADDGTIDCPADAEDDLRAALEAAYSDADAGDAGDAEADEACGVEMSDGSTCERPADDCQYHDEEE